MKKRIAISSRSSILLMTIFFLLLFSCDTMSPSGTEHQIVGSWRWLQSCCGFGGDLRTPENTGHEIMISFTPLNSYYQYNNQSLEVEGYYSIYQKKIWGNTSQEVIKMDNNSEMIIQFNTADTLLLTDTCIDCYRHIYVRLD